MHDRINNQLFNQHLKQNNMKNYSMLFLDKLGNELDRRIEPANNIKDVRQLAKKIIATSMINDLKRIKVTKVK